MAEFATGEDLSDRLHDMLLRMAGRVDDDALTSARELVAIAELDRAGELLVGCLIAGGVPVTPEEHKHLRGLLDQARSDPALADRLKVRDTWYAPPHRFSSEPDPGEGIGDALRPVMGFLQGIRSVQAVWRVTPAGATPGAVPQRIVLVEIGAEGFAPATAYRIGQALESAGLRAVVEVLRAGTELSDYHVMAATVALPVNLDGKQSSSADRGSTRRPPKQTATPTPTASTPTASRSTAVAVEHVVDEPAASLPIDPEPLAAEAMVAAESMVAETIIVERSAEPPRPDAGPPVIEPPVDPAALGLVDYQPPAEDELSDVERDLLRQLHEELAQREQQPKPEHDSEWSGDIPQSRSSSSGAQSN